MVWGGCDAYSGPNKYLDTYACLNVIALDTKYLTMHISFQINIAQVQYTIKTKKNVGL